MLERGMRASWNRIEGLVGTENEGRLKWSITVCWSEE